MYDPLAPETLVSALQDPVHVDMAVIRPARSVKVRLCRFCGTTQWKVHHEALVCSTACGDKFRARREMLIRDESSLEKKAFWDHVKMTAEDAKKLPPWMKAGIDINPECFETYEPERKPMLKVTEVGKPHTKVRLNSSCEDIPVDKHEMVQELELKRLRSALNELYTLRQSVSELQERNTALVEQNRELKANTVNELVKRSHENSKAHGFWESDNIPEKLALIHSEVSEALECYRINHMYTCYDTEKNDKPEGFPSEIADVVIRCCDLAGHLGIDLERIVKEKAEYNASRPHKHGKKC